MPEDEKTTRSGSQAEEAKGSRKPARKKQAKPAEAKKGSARKPAAKDEPEKAPAKKAAEKPKAEPKPKAPAKKGEPVPVVVRASARYVRTAPRKARLVADQIRGLQIDKARALLEFSPRGAARDIQKLIDSAASNAENNHELVADDMRVVEITVDEGPTLRRFRPRALGRATRINKRTSHISVALSPEEEA